MNAFNINTLFSTNNTPSPPILSPIAVESQAATLNFTRPSFPNISSRSYTYSYIYSPGNVVGTIGQVVIPFNISGLTNGTTYSFKIRASYDNLFTNYSNIITVIPDLKPNQPSITECTPGYKSITVIFTKSTDNIGSSINYYYVYYSTSTVTISSTKIQVPSTGVSSYSIPITADLITTDGTYYNIAVAAFNTLLSDLSAITLRPYTNPSAPGRPSLAPGNQQITVNFTASTFSGYGTISKYRIYYSQSTFNTYISSYIEVTTTTGTLSSSQNLINGEKYYVAVAAFNGVLSNLSDVSSVYPFTTPTNIEITSVVAGDTSITVNFKPPSNTGGFPIYGYGYWISDSLGSNDYPDIVGSTNHQIGIFPNTHTTPTYVTFSQVGNDPSSSLINGTRYYMFLFSLSINLNDNQYVYGTGNFPSSTPCKAPSAPSFTLSIASGTITITNTVPNGDNSTSTPNNGGSPLTNYILSINPDAGTFSSASTLFTTLTATNDNTTTTCDITGLTNGTPYIVTLTAVNNKGSSLPTSITATPDVKPEKITTFSTTSQYESITVNFTAPSNTGSTIDYYNIYYSKSPVVVSTSSPFVQVDSTVATTYSKNITGLTVDGSYYNIAIASFNTLLSVLSDTNSSARPYTKPSAPGRPSLAPGNRLITLNFAASTNGYGTISYYRIYYSTAAVTTSTSTYVDVTTNSNALIPSPNLTNGLKYNVAIAAYNGSYSDLSDPSSAYPFTNAGQITVTSVVAGDKSITVNFTPPSDTGGFPIYGYESWIGDSVRADGYPAGNLQYPTFENASTTNTSVTFSISSGATLLNGTRYYMMLVPQTINLNKGSVLNDTTVVYGIDKNVDSAVPFTDPSGPTSITSGFYNGAVVVTFQAPLNTNGGTNLSYVLILDTLNSSGKITRGPTNSLYTTTTGTGTYKFTVTNLNSNAAIANGTTYYLELDSKTLDPNNSNNALYGVTYPNPVTPLAGIPTYTVGPGPSNIQITSINGATGFGTTGYYMYYNTSDSFSGVSPIDIGNKTSHIIYSVFNGTDYWVKLVAYNNYGTSSDGATVKVTPILGTFTNVVYGKMAIVGSKLYYPVFNSVYSLDSQTYQYAIVELSANPITITKVSNLTAYPLMFFTVGSVMNVLYSTSKVRGDGTTTISGGFNATSNYFYGYNSGSSGGFFGGSRNVLKMGTVNLSNNTISEAGSSPLNGNTFAAADILNDNSSLILVTDTNGPTVKYWNPPSSSGIGSVTSNTSMNYCTGIEFFAVNGNGFFCAYSTDNTAYTAGKYKTFFIAKGTYANNTLTTTYEKFFDSSDTTKISGGGVTQNHITSITYSENYLYVALYGTAVSGNGSNISKVYKLTTNGTSATIVSGWPVTTIGMIQSMIVYNTTLHYSTYTNGVYTIYSIAA